MYRRLLSGLGAPIPTGLGASAQPLLPLDADVVVDHPGATAIHSRDDAPDQFVQLFPLGQRGDEDGDEAMERIERRVFMQSAAVFTGLGVGGGVAALEAVRHELNGLVADEPRAVEVEEWGAIALDYGQAYLVTAPATLLATLLVDLRGVQGAMQRHPGESEQRELMRAGALLAAFTALTVANLGDLGAARRWWRSARHAADKSADPFTRFWVRGCEVAQHEHRPVLATLRLVVEADALLDEAPPAAWPEFLSGKAQVLALAGQLGAAERALGQLRECASTFVGRNRDSLFDFAESNLRYVESAVYSHAGSFVKAEQAQQAALAACHESSLRGPAQIELQRALCLVRSGDPAEGARHAQAVITGLPVMHRLRPVADLGQKVFSAIPVSERRRSWAVEYHECLESALPGEGVGNSVQHRRSSSGVGSSRHA
ncbi:MAG: hypothetical protein ACRDRH_27730 [Pseudonocardia sp.]